LVHAAASGAQGSPSELQHRIVHRFLAGNPVMGEADVLELSPFPPAGEAHSIGLAALEGLLSLIRNLLGSARSLDGRDFAPAQAPIDAGRQTADLASRAQALIDRFVLTHRPLQQALAATNKQPATVHAALLKLSNAGFPGAFPTLLTTRNVPLGSEAIGRLFDQARDVDAAAKGALARIAALDAAWAARVDKSAAEVEYQVARICELLGKDFLVLAPFVIQNAPELAASLSDQPALRGDDAFVLTNWLQRLALVRPSLDRFAGVVTATTMLGTMPPAAGLTVVQLPHSPGAPWLSLPQRGKSPAADLATVLHSLAPITFDDSIPLAGFFCDDWSEAIPVDAETVAATFHYDAPGARPPQAVLVATPPSMSQANWSTDLLLDVISEALELARLRMVSPLQLDFHGQMLPTTYLPDAITREVPTVNLSKFREATHIASITTTGKNVIWTSS